MPILQLHLLEGRPSATKAQLVEELTRTVERVLGSPTDRIQILISEYGDGQWAKGGRALELNNGTVS
jgi:4-oxalocrotonate tautomerase|nr:hypothetical protein [Aeromicrobium sp.]